MSVRSQEPWRTKPPRALRAKSRQESEVRKPKRRRTLGSLVGSPPRAPALATSEVASYYVQYNRGPLRGFLFLFSFLLFLFAAVGAFVWNDWFAVVSSIAVGALLLVLGLWAHPTTPLNVRARVSDSDEPKEAGTHQPD